MHAKHEEQYAYQHLRDSTIPQEQDLAVWLRLLASSSLRLSQVPDPVDEYASTDAIVLHSNKRNLTISAAYL